MADVVKPGPIQNPFSPLPNNPYNGTNPTGPGVAGQSNTGPGVSGQSIGLPPAGAIATQHTASDGVLGQGLIGVHGISTVQNSSGVMGENSVGDGVLGAGFHGVHGTSSASGGSGVWGQNTSGGAGVSGMSTNGIGVHGTNTGSGFAGQFDGDCQVNGNHTVTKTITGIDVVLTGGDCAEQFDSYDAGSLQPGTVAVIDDDGKLRKSCGAYDKRVAGVVSGAGDYKPGIVLDGRPSSEGRVSVALVGKVYCKVDADPAPVAVGDLLTTSGRPGFAMKAVDHSQAFGAVIGKALKPLRAGQGMIPILVALQ